MLQSQKYETRLQYGFTELSDPTWTMNNDLWSRNNTKWQWDITQDTKEVWEHFIFS